MYKKSVPKQAPYRMYGLVPYNISPIQQGIQFGHAVVEYAIKYGSNQDFKSWAKRDKTFIILNGGTTNLSKSAPGTLNVHLKTLKDLKIKYAAFYEPDLGDQLTAIVFLVPESVYATPSYKDWASESDGYLTPEEEEWEWIDAVGGKKNVALKEFISKFRLA